MFSNVIILVVTVVTVSCYDHQVYAYRNALQHPSLKEHHKHQQYHHIRVQPEPSSSEEYNRPQAQHFQVQESHESNDHVAPVYQQVEEQPQYNQEYAQHEAVKHKYETVQYPVPAHHDYQTLSVPSHQADSQEEITYHHPTAHHSAPIQHAPIEHEAESHHSHDSHDEPIDYYAYPKYQYEYKVEDPHTGDNKFQHEYRDGDVVKGVYGLHEADGSIRTVEYSSDKHHGFSAVVKHTAPGQHVHFESHHQN